MESFLLKTDIARWVPGDYISSQFAGLACIRAAENSPPHALRPFWPMAWYTKRFCDQEFLPNQAWHVWLKDIHGNPITRECATARHSLSPVSPSNLCPAVHSPIGNFYRVRLQQHDLVRHQLQSELGQPAVWLAKFWRCWHMDPADPGSSFAYADSPSFYLTLEYHLNHPSAFHPVARTPTQ